MSVTVTVRSLVSGPGLPPVVHPNATSFEIDEDVLYVNSSTPGQDVAVYAKGAWSSAVVG